MSEKKRKDLILSGFNVTRLLKEKYSKLKKTGWITLLNAPMKNYIEVNNEALRVLLEDMDFNGIYITVNKPYPELAKIFAEKGLDTTRLKFVDAISQTYGVVPKETTQCTYVFGPLNIEAIVNAVDEFIPKQHEKPEKIFVFIDSITTVLLYNHLPRTIRFSQFLTQKLKSLAINGIMVSVAAGMTSERLIEEIKNFCDEVIDINI